MTLEQLNKINEKFQQQAGKLTELFPGGNMLEFSSFMIREAQKLDALLRKTIAAKGENAFHSGLEKMEDEMDEIVFLLDRMDESNRMKKIEAIDGFVKQGFDLLSLYSICCDQLIERRIKAQEEAE